MSMHYWRHAIFPIISGPLKFFREKLSQGIFINAITYIIVKIEKIY